MAQLAVRDENGSRGSSFVMTYVQQFDTLTFSRQALESQLNVGKTFEFDMEAQTRLKPGAPMDLSGGFGGTSTLLNLVQQRSAMLRPVLFGDRFALPATSRATVRLCFGDALKNEVPVPTRPRLRHWVPCPSPYSP